MYEIFEQNIRDFKAEYLRSLAKYSEWNNYDFEQNSWDFERNVWDFERNV